MTSSVTRRQMLARTEALATTAIAGSSRTAFSSPQVQVESLRVISKQPQYYCGWPTVARRKNGELLLAYSGGRQFHSCPFGRVEMMRSKDNGQTWSWPRVLMDGPIDDRDAGVLETSKGTILVTSFTDWEWEEWFRLGKTPELYAKSKKTKWEGAPTTESWTPENLKRWQAAANRLSPEQRKKELGVYMLRSTDGGITFSAQYDCLVNSPHGPIQLSDGRLLYAGKRLGSIPEVQKDPAATPTGDNTFWANDKKLGVCESTDDGQTWRWLAEIPAGEGEDPSKYHELHAVEAADGRIIVQFRNHNKGYRIRQSESTDGGKTWSVPHSTGVHGLPPHLLRLQDDRLLMTYGYRIPPEGNRVCISENHGRDWSKPFDLQHDATSRDLGYPSSVQLDDGSLLTVWYETLKGSKRAVLRQARWSLES